MKRSEMLELINQCLHDYSDDDFMVEKPSEFVSELLNRIEQSGMLPPSHIPIADIQDPSVDFQKFCTKLEKKNEEK